MDIVSLKEYIYENNKIEYVLEQIGCKNIKYNNNKEYYSCSNYDGDNPTAVNVTNNKYLNVKNWTRVNEFADTSDIVDLVQYNKKCSFIDAVRHLHDILGIEYTKYNKPEIKEEPKFDPLAIFKRAKTSKRRVNIDEIKTLDEEMLDEYIPILHIDFFRDGIMPWTSKKFGLMYSYKKKRVVIPIRHWMTGDLVGLNMRTTVENHEELGITKYFISPSYQKSLNLFGLNENYESIQKAGYVVVYESERSVLKRDSLGDGTGVALSGKSLSEEQIRILIGLNVEIIIAMDNDVSIEEVRHMCSKFYRIRNVSYIKDKWDLLEDKQSPADAKNKVFNFLLKFRNKYTNDEHIEYLNSLNR